MARIIYIVSAVVVVAAIGVYLNSPVKAVALSHPEQTAVRQSLQAKHLSEPHAIALSATAFVAADYELDPARTPTDPASLRTFGEARLLAIREALIPFGFEDYLVTLHRRSPTGVDALGAVRVIDGGKIEWVKP